MPYNAGTNRKAIDFDRYVQLALQKRNCNYRANIWDNGVGSGTSVVNTNGGIKDAYIRQLQTEFENGMANFAFTKYAGNYIIGQTYGAGLIEFYPPCILYEGPGNFKILGKVNGDCWGYTSADGEAFTQTGLMFSKGSSGQWDDFQSSPNVLKALLTGGYVAFFCGYGDSPAYNHKIGIATKSSPWGTGWTKDPSNPVYTVTPYNNNTGSSMDGISLTNITLVGNRYYYFGSAYSNSENSADLIYGIGDANAPITAIRLNQKIGNVADFNPAYTWLQGFSVFKHPDTGVYMGTFTMGRLSSSGGDNQAIYAITSGRTDAPIFTLDGFRSYPILYPDASLIFENNYNYAANWLTDDYGNLIPINNKRRLYYSAHQNTATPTYTGVTCLAEISSIPII